MSEPLRISRRAFVAALPVIAAAVPGTRMEVGCQANAWPLKPGDFDGLLRVVGAIKEMGYTGFECNQRFVVDQLDHASEAGAKIAQTGMKFIGAHTSLESSKPDELRRLTVGLAAMKCQFVVMSARGLSQEGKFEDAALLKKTAALESMGRICKDNGVALAYHNHNPEFAGGNAEIEGLARHTDPALVNFLIDAGHGYWGGGDPPAFLTSHADHIVGFHLKTYKGKEQVRMGRGDWEFDKLAAAVKKTGWRGWLMTEEGGGPKTGDAADVAADREYIRRVFGV